MADIREELKKLYGNDSSERKRKYFLWKNKLDTVKTEYTEMDEEEFKDFARCTELEWNYLLRWEESEEYKRLMYVLHKDNFDNDILEIYNAMKEEAKKGNSTAVKTVISLQKEIKKRLKNYNKEEEGTGLKLDI
ncbi:hypothetical protein [Anaerosalibacter massiliensis]|uniref:hypothetical protein n=1 Tax=Anaerosalibacter massiliensis TaxID=1347392 RepID=UPI000678AC0B|nr:hypothetical protein [Anaerosalibacter massiliensis]